MQRILSAIVAVFLALWADRLAIGQDTDPVLPAEISGAADAWKYKALLSSFLRERSNEELRGLATVEDDSVALSAQWALVRRSAERLIKEAGVERGSRSVRPRSDLDRCVGFIQGRLPVVLPEWWEASVARARFFADDWEVFTPGASRAKYEAIGETPLLSSPIRNAGQRDDGIQILITVRPQTGGRNIVIPSEWIAEWGGYNAVEYVTYGATEDADYVAFHRSSEGEYPLLKVDRNTGAVVWSATVWAGRPYILGRTGTGYWHHVEIVDSDMHVYVFGALNWSVYIEAFEKTDGVNVLRFSSTYTDPNDMFDEMETEN